MNSCVWHSFRSLSWAGQLHAQQGASEATSGGAQERVPTNGGAQRRFSGHTESARENQPVSATDFQPAGARNDDRQA